MGLPKVQQGQRGCQDLKGEERMYSALAATEQFPLMQQETLRIDLGSIRILYAIEEL